MFISWTLFESFSLPSKTSYGKIKYGDYSTQTLVWTHTILTGKKFNSQTRQGLQFTSLLSIEYFSVIGFFKRILNKYLHHINAQRRPYLQEKRYMHDVTLSGETNWRVVNLQDLCFPLKTDIIQTRQCFVLKTLNCQEYFL